MFGINPYTERPLNMALPKRLHRVDFDDLDWLSKRLGQRWPSRHLKIFIDEFGWNTEHGASGWLYVVSRAQQATLLTKAFQLVGRLHRAPPRRYGWLDERDGSGVTLREHFRRLFQQASLRLAELHA